MQGKLAQTNQKLTDMNKEFTSQLNVGRVLSISGNVVEVEFFDSKPFQGEVLVFRENPDVRLEVYSLDTENKANCLCFTGIENLYRGAEILRTGETIKMPVGEETLGRLIDLFGNPQDHLGPLTVKDFTSVYREPPGYHEVESSKEVLETGIKVIDFFTPFRKGGKIGLFGGAGVGKTILLTELIPQQLEIQS